MVGIGITLGTLGITHGRRGIARGHGRRGIIRTMAHTGDGTTVADGTMDGMATGDTDTITITGDLADPLQILETPTTGVQVEHWLKTEYHRQILTITTACKMLQAAHAAEPAIWKWYQTGIRLVLLTHQQMLTQETGAATLLEIQREAILRSEATLQGLLQEM